MCPTFVQTWSVTTSVTCPLDRAAAKGYMGKGKGREDCPADPSALVGEAEITLKAAAVAEAIAYATSTNYCLRLVDTEGSSGAAKGKAKHMGQVEPSWKVEEGTAFFGVPQAIGVPGSTDGAVDVTVTFPTGAPIDLTEAAACAASIGRVFVEWCGCNMSITAAVTSSAAAGATATGKKGKSNQCAFQYNPGRGVSRAGSRAASVRRVTSGASMTMTATTTTTTTVVVAAVAIIVVVAVAMVLVQRRVSARNAVTMANNNAQMAIVVAAEYESKDTMVGDYESTEDVVGFADYEESSENTMSVDYDSEDTMSNCDDAATMAPDAFEEETQLS